MNNLSIILKILIFIYFIFTDILHTFSQTFRNGFDNYESGSGGAYGQGFSFHSNIKNELGYKNNRWWKKFN